jgi:isoamylase
MKWYVAINSGMPVGQDIYPLGEEPLLDHQEGIILSARSVMVLVGR